MSTLDIAQAPSLDVVKTKATELLAKHLKMDPAEVDQARKLTSYGLDSIDAFTMLGDLEDWLGIELPSTLLWDYNSVQDLAAYIVQNFSELAA